MSNEIDKVKNSSRRHRDESAINRQVKIAKEFGIKVEEPHKLVKHHVMNCGNPKCIMCGNPRKMFKEKTIQEKRFDQDIDKE